MTLLTATPLAENAVTRDVAVIDIGSNSVRLVHYRLEGRAVWPVYNEKVMAGLGRGIRDTGRLHDEGYRIALRALKRFQRLLRAKSITDVYPVATAAVRYAQDGQDFVDEVRALTGFEIRVLTGEEEGALSAQGLLSGIPAAHGMMGDLGGASLELTDLVSGESGLSRSVPLGPQSILTEQDEGLGKAKARIKTVLKEIDGLKGRGGTFYAVGGAWRALTHLAFAQTGYPLHVVHQFALNDAQTRTLTRFAMSQSPASLRGIPNLSQRRMANLPYAALLLRQIMKHGAFDQVVFSANGLREGVLMQQIPPAIREQDPLIAGADALARPIVPSIQFGTALLSWMQPFLDVIPRAFSEHDYRRYVEAACRMVDLGARFHPDHRGQLVRDTVLYAPLAGCCHAGRVFIAAILQTRYGETRSEPDAILSLLDRDQRATAEAVGLVMRLAAKLSGRSPELLERFEVDIDRARIRLDVAESVHDLYVERALSNLDQIASRVGRAAQVRYLGADAAE